MANAADSGQIRIGHFEANRIGFGAMRITGEHAWGEPADRDNSIRVLRRAVELGVNVIDTADSYGPDVSENLIREALHPYDGLLIATKGGFLRTAPTADSPGGTWPADASPQHLRRALDGSLARLGVETIDLYQLHTPDPDVPFEESVGALVELKEAGKIRHIGLCNVSLEQLRAAQRLTEIVSVQNRYNVEAADASDAIVDHCAEHGVAFMPYEPVGGGYSALERLQAVARKHRATPHQIALAWLLSRSPIMLPIPGTSSAAHLESNLAAGTIELDAEDLAGL